MPASPAQIEANRQNSLKSSGPRTPEGKEKSRGNALKHGLAGNGIVLPESDAAEVERLTVALGREMKAHGEVETMLVRRLAVQAVRMDRGASQEMAAVAENVRIALENFEAPEGATEEEADILRAEAGHIALFDPSKEASLARKYEAAAERGFFRALKELRQHQRKAATSAMTADQGLAQQEADTRASLAQFESLLVETNPISALAKPLPSPTPVEAKSTSFAPVAHFDIPMTIGRAR